MKLSPLLYVFAVCTARAELVTNTLPSGPGSLREAFNNVLRNDSGPITFAPELSGQTISGSGEFDIAATFEIHPVLGNFVTIDAGNLPGGITITGPGTIFRVPSGTGLTLNNLTLTGATDSGQGGAISSYGSLQLTRCTFANNSGSAITALGSINTTFITRCTFFGNGTGLTCTATGGATLTHCTVSGNNTGIVVGYRYPRVTVNNCIIAGNTQDVSNGSVFVREGANIIQTLANTGSPPYPGSDSGPPAITAAPLLAPPGNYGGPTMTMALLPGSPARNASVGGLSGFDQRGYPIVGIPDIGAYEAGTPGNYNAWIYESLPATAGAAEREATFDFDGDGQTNGDEFVFATNPDSRTSFFSTKAVKEGNNVRISFDSAAGRSYTLQQNGSLGPAAWENAAGQTQITGDGGAKSFLVPVAGSRQFFRVRGSY